MKWFLLFYATLASAAPMPPAPISSQCREYPIYEEVLFFKDPSVWLETVKEVFHDPSKLSEVINRENPVRETLKGMVRLKAINETQIFKNFHWIAGVYQGRYPSLAEFAKRENTAFIIQVKKCDAADSDGAMGFILEKQWMKGLENKKVVGLPPSTLANPVPKWP